MPSCNPRRIRPIILCLAAILCAPFAFAQDTARLPYEMAYRYLQFFESLEHLERIAPGMMITSTNPGVKSADIEFTLQDGGNTSTLQLDENGVIDIPVNPAWLESGLVLVSNQPKGTMQLEIAFHARPVTSNQMKYADLMALATEFEEAMTALAELQGNRPPTIYGLTIQMPPGGTIDLLAKRKQKLEPNAAGFIVLKTDKRLEKENPEIVFSELPLGILPLQ